VAETWSDAELLAAGWRAEDLAWERSAEEVLAALASGDIDAARQAAARGLRLAREHFEADDPRLVASLHGNGVCLKLDGRHDLAARLLDEAAAAWRRTGSWIDRMHAPRTARSSLFHMRMEGRHRATYEERWRAKWQDLEKEARAVTTADLSGVAAGDAAARLDRWRRERPAMLNDTRKLMAAVILMAGPHQTDMTTAEATP